VFIGEEVAWVPEPGWPQYHTPAWILNPSHAVHSLVILMPELSHIISVTWIVASLRLYFWNTDLFGSDCVYQGGSFLIGGILAVLISCAFIWFLIPFVVTLSLNLTIWRWRFCCWVCRAVSQILIEGWLVVLNKWYTQQLECTLYGVAGMRYTATKG